MVIKQSSYIAYIFTLTPTHVGVGRTEDVVDLPVQRDIFGYPTIYSSSLKGALRSYFTRQNNVDNNNIRAVFGDENGIGGYNFLDAYLLVIPARLLKGVVVGVTSPFLLKQYNRISGLVRPSDNNALDIPPINEGSYTPLIGDLRGRITVNEVGFERSGDGGNDYQGLKKVLENVLKDVLGSVLPYDKIIVVSDEDFKNVILPRSMMIVTRVKLDNISKKVSAGPWTEEYIPPGTVFFTIITRNPWQKNGGASLTNLLQGEHGGMRLQLILGGDETIGRGFVEIRFDGVGVGGGGGGP